MRRITPFLIAGTLGASLAARAAADSDCPTAADLERGIVFEMQGKNHTMAFSQQHLDGDTYWQAFSSPLGLDAASETFRGLVTLRTYSRKGELTRTDTFQYDFTSMFPLKTGASFRFDGVRTNGRSQWLIDRTITVGEMGEFAVGACRYPTFELEITDNMVLPSGERKTYSETVRYSEDLSYVLSTTKHRLEHLDLVRLRQDGDWFKR
ncbi:MAG: hypothetical protein EP335_08090 [Alphaproteobacteria bacterium]|nr:MAG: hypothetical protein EP335_08090 [Alphaproteobacteria bacterium]